MTRRYYRIRPLEHLEQRLVDGVRFVFADYEHRGVRHHVAATLGEPDELPGALRALKAHAATLPAGEPLLADLYAREPEPPDLDRMLADAGLPDSIARVVFVLAPRRSRGQVDVLTFSRGPDGTLAEDGTCAGCIR